MKRIEESRTLFEVEKDASLSELKKIYRNLVKKWHPDKFNDDDKEKKMAEIKSKKIIEAYHFLVSISAEKHEQDIKEYTTTITSAAISDHEFKRQVLKITFNDGSAYEYFGVTQSIYQKLVNSDKIARFARRHIFNKFLHRKMNKQNTED